MGKIEKDKHDGFFGDLGPVTVTRWKDRVVVKMRQQGSDKPRSAKQKAASKRFGMLTRFVSVCNEYITIGFQNTNKGNAQHAAIAANMEHGVVGEWPELRLNYEKMKMSEGNLDPLRESSAMVDDGLIKLCWEKVEDNGVINILVYNIDTEEAIVETNIASIADLETSLPLPKVWRRNEMHIVVYACLSCGSEVSESSYLGMHEIGEGLCRDYSGKIYMAKKSYRKRKKTATEEELGDDEKRHVLGAIGKIGPVIAYDYKGINCIKGRYTIEKEPTEKKRKANEKFRVLTRFLKSMYEMVKVGYRSESGSMTPLNAAIKRNYGKAFEEGSSGLAFESIELSVGKLPPPKRLRAWRDGDELIVTWDVSGIESDDSVMLGVYNEDNGEGFVVQNAGQRPDGKLQLTLPTEWKEGARLHLYLAFASSNETSPTVYIKIPSPSSPM